MSTATCKRCFSLSHFPADGPCVHTDAPLRSSLLPERYLSPAEMLANASVSRGAAQPRLDHCSPCWGATVLAMYNDAAEPVGQTLDIGFEIREPGRYSLVAGVLHWRGCKLLIRFLRT